MLGYRPEQIQHLESQQLVRIPIYRWDRQREQRRKHSAFRYESEYPLYAEVIVFSSVLEFALEPEVHLEYYIVERIRFIPQKGVVVFETDFPVGLQLRVRAWNASLHPSEEVVGKYIERVRWFVLWEEVAHDIVLS